MAAKQAATKATTEVARMPKGIPFIIGNETAERFNFYGMRAILMIFMTHSLLGASGQLDVMTADEAKTIFHLSNTAIYFFPILGAIFADALFGKYRTVMWFSVLYAIGSLVLAMDQTRFGLYVGLTLIAIGSGGIKPCVSAIVGDQFTATNKSLMEAAYNYFYAGINAGALGSMLLTPVLLDEYGPRIAFGVPAVMMLMATLVFWLGRHKYVRVPAKPNEFLKEVFSKAGVNAMVKSGIIFAFIAMFWSLYDQSGGAWVLQAEKMDLEFLGIEWLASQVQVINPALILILAPIFGKWGYPWINKIFRLTPLRKIGIGFFITIFAFLIPAWIEVMIQNGEVPNIIWQLLAYFWITVAEVFVSVTALEFAYKQAPPRMKSIILALFLLSVSLGNAFTSGVNWFIQNPAPSFTPDVAGVYMIELEASDDTTTVRDAMVVAVTPKQLPHTETAAERQAKIAEQMKKKPLTASAGHMRAVRPGTPVNLYGTVEKGDAKDSLRYRWIISEAPSGSKINGYTTNNRIFRFVPDMEGKYVATFRVQSGKEDASAKVEVLATTANVPPVVNSGDDQTVELGNTVELNGGSTFDPNGNTLRYLWRLAETPRDSQLSPYADITSSNCATVTSKLTGAMYYVFFAVMLFLTSLLYIPVAWAYKAQEYIAPDATTEKTTTTQG